MDNAFDKLLTLLSELPTESAMKELGKSVAPLPSTRKVVETMALKKKELMGVIAHMRTREMVLMTNANADKVMREYLLANPDVDVQIVRK